MGLTRDTLHLLPNQSTAALCGLPHVTRLAVSGNRGLAYDCRDVGVGRLAVPLCITLLQTRTGDHRATPGVALVACWTQHSCSERTLSRDRCDTANTGYCVNQDVYLLVLPPCGSCLCLGLTLVEPPAYPLAGLAPNPHTHHPLSRHSAVSGLILHCIEMHHALKHRETYQHLTWRAVKCVLRPSTRQRPQCRV
jgi:hypothetical protein